MSVKPVTYQGVFSFKANLYALEVKSRFIDQSKANGYYKGYGEELAATVVGTQIKIGTGAFVVQGRMNEITAAEMVSPQMFDGFVGYVIARIETYHPSDEENCTIAAVVNRSFEAIALTQEDTYAAAADNSNKVYELPLYSFKIVGNTITELKKLIGAVEDYATIKGIVDNALKSAGDALTKATSSDGKADNAVRVAGEADGKADNAVRVAGEAQSAASEAVETANTAAETVQREHGEMTAEIQRLAGLIVEGQGTTVKVDGVGVPEYDATDVLKATDELNIDGGGV